MGGVAFRKFQDQKCLQNAPNDIKLNSNNLDTKSTLSTVYTVPDPESQMFILFALQSFFSFFFRGIAHFRISH